MTVTPVKRSHLMPHARRLAAAVLIVAMTCVAPPARAEDGPRDAIQQLTDAALKVLGDKSLDTETKRHRLEDLVYARMDFDTMTRLVLARNYTRFSPEQREEFTRLFKEHLSLTYGRSIESYRNERVEITADRKEPDGDWTVKSKIVRGGGDDVMLDYRLRQENGVWKIIDVIPERVSMVSNFRSQFQDLISRGGPEHVLAVLREKNAKREPLKQSS
jgi:phospholipid transport system substrate-binding protein